LGLLCIEQTDLLFDPIHLFLQCVLGYRLSLDGLKLNLRVDCCMPYLYVDAGCEQDTSFAIEARRRIETRLLRGIFYHLNALELQCIPEHDGP
jgi:hypothetical protein